VNRTTGDSIYVQAVDTDGSALPVTSWRNGDGVDPDAYVAKECTAGHNCDIVSNGSLVPEDDTASERGMRIQALDSVQHALETYGAIMDTSVELHYPGKSDCETSCFVSRHEIHVAEASATTVSRAARAGPCRADAGVQPGLPGRRLWRLTQPDVERN